MVSRVPLPALPDLRLALWLAGWSWSAARQCPRKRTGRHACSHQSQGSHRVSGRTRAVAYEGRAGARRLGGSAADVEVELDGQAGVADGVADVAESFGFDALVEGAQVGGLAGGDGDDDFGVAGVADDPGPGGVHAVVGADFPGHRAGERGGPQDRGPLVGGDGDGDVAGPVGGDEQGHDPAQREQVITRQSRRRRTTPSSVVADVAADAVGEQGTP